MKVHNFSPPFAALLKKIRPPQLAVTPLLDKIKMPKTAYIIRFQTP